MRPGAVLKWLPLLLLASVGWACEVTRGPEAIQRGADRWEQGLEQEDPEMVVEPYEPGGVLLLPGSGAVVGRDNARDAWTAWFQRYELSYDFEVEGLGADGRVGYRYGTIRARGVDRVERRSIRMEERFMQIWRRQRDGSWRIALDMWDPPAGERGHSR